MRWSLATIVLVPRGAKQHADAAERYRVLEWAAATGFGGLEISPHWVDLDGLSDRELVDFQRAAAQEGLCVSGINVNRCLFTRGPRAAEVFAKMQRAVEAAAILGSRLVTFSLSQPMEPDRPPLRGSDFTGDERQKTADGLHDLAMAAARNGAEISLELHDDGMLDTAEYFIDMAQRIGTANVGVNPDLGNLIRGGNASGDWEETLKQLAPRTNNWDVKNYKRGQPAPLWDGDIDYARAVQIMQAAGYRGWVSIESYFGDALDLQLRSLTYLRQLVESGEGNRITSQESAA